MTCSPSGLTHTAEPKGDGWHITLTTHTLAPFVALESDRPGRFSANAVTLFPGHPAPDHLHPGRARPAPHLHPARPAQRHLRPPKVLMFSYQLYSSRNFPPLAETLDDAGRRSATTASKATARSMPTTRWWRNWRPASPPPACHADRPFRPGPAGSRPRQGAVHRAVPRHRAHLLPLPHARRPPDGRRGLARLRRSGCKRRAQPFRAAGLGFGWHNHDFEFVALPDGTLPQDRDLRGRPRPGMGNRRGLGHPRRRRPARLDREIRRPASPRPMSRTSPPRARTRTRTAGPIVGQGTVDWKAVMTALRSHRPARNFVMEHDNPSDHARFATRSRSRRQRSSDTWKSRHRHHRLRQHLDRLSARSRRSSRAWTVRAVADMNLDAAQARAAEFNVQAQSVEDLLANPGHRRGHQPDHPRRAFRRVEGDPSGGQARLFRKAADPHAWRTASPCATSRRRRACASAARPTPSSAARTSRPAR